MKYDLSTLSYIFLFISVIVLIISFTTIYKEKIKLRYTQREQEIFNSEIKQIRYDLERQLFHLNDKLLSSEERWRDVNHLLINSQKNIDFKSNQKFSEANSTFLKNSGININEITLEKNFIFYLTPFHDQKKSTYYTVKRVCEDMNLTFKRGDEIYLEKKNILTHILENIVKARLIIVNIDGRNPNVYYELGIAHALNKPTILISNDINSVPFDLQSNYIITYANNDELEIKLSRALTDTIINM